MVMGPGLVADPVLLAETAEREFAALGVTGEIVHARDAAEVAARTSGDALIAPSGWEPAGLADAPGPENESDTPAMRGGAAIVVVPGPTPEVRRLMREALGPVVWLDLARVDEAVVGEGAAHIHGRGVEGLVWAVRHAVHRLRHPRVRVPYGPHRDQWAELYLPARRPLEEGPATRAEARPVAGGEDAGARRVKAPVVALIHGGYWRSHWAADLMDALCLDLVARGFAVWNLEYRRPDLHGWRATTADVATGLDALAAVDAPIDLDRVAVAGHSAGAQLALRAAADGARVCLAVSLAGVLDLVEAHHRRLGAGAVAMALGTGLDPAGPEAEPGVGVYGRASPMLRLPLKVRTLIVQGSGDELDLVDFGRRYARAAREAGDDMTYLEMSGDHFAVIDPRTPIWRTTALAMADALK